MAFCFKQYMGLILSLPQYSVKTEMLIGLIFPQNFIRRCLVYRKEERADVLTLCEDPYLKPPMNKKNSSLQNVNSQTWQNATQVSQKDISRVTTSSRPWQAKTLLLSWCWQMPIKSRLELKLEHSDLKDNCILSLKLYFTIVVIIILLFSSIKEGLKYLIYFV